MVAVTPKRNLFDSLYGLARLADGDLGQLRIGPKEAREITDKINSLYDNAEDAYDHGFSNGSASGSIDGFRKGMLEERLRWRALPWWKRLFP